MRFYRFLYIMWSLLIIIEVCRLLEVRHSSGRVRESGEEEDTRTRTCLDAEFTSGGTASSESNSVVIYSCYSHKLIHFSGPAM